MTAQLHGQDPGSGKWEVLHAIERARAHFSVINGYANGRVGLKALNEMGSAVLKMSRFGRRRDSLLRVLLMRPEVGCSERIVLQSVYATVNPKTEQIYVKLDDSNMQQLQAVALMLKEHVALVLEPFPAFVVTDKDRDEYGIRVVMFELRK